MNVMPASGGYPWTIIPLERREEYMAALESASVRQDIRPFATFVGGLVEGGLRGRPAPSVSGSRRRSGLWNRIALPQQSGASNGQNVMP